MSPRCPNHYCSNPACLRTTSRVRVRLGAATYLYCVACKRRLEVRRACA